ncbi:MAG: hypothetical protein A3G32_05040 [Deltaproteobacteria bacterium RIFCSPLOWO2_12_FULL_40_28]|nr:MAG: hypothetical protein A3C45_09150 [Deltaproteobacteria bacterium RIFCSPHIGHO2_02_FULL_40_28]OGQ19730.1 MAG: hypothetical protein A3E27_08345 [Deltaproteobacteria bacterium RIFCSPHIGHO2_12_FULL_40_32]OGQ41007.1 MAG: hypothetical protein A3I69_03760 [Deltaproteobacteria bacterium RIFCSPLOWO2_02_FULL_40_36]OGQ54123.1 MAG: hypothetical protein A3G32_05040 [Deltaproteobacteria bacterium RIFCSPLOWO2_12_FULL_40_28]
MVELIANKYRVLKQLGQGAMGEVYLVLPPRGDPVALKLLKTVEIENEKASVEQFENEFKVLKKISHPNIGQIYDYGYDSVLKKVYFTLPWLKGSDLYAVTKDASYEACENYFIQVLRALNYLHQKGLIHCDIKPGNVFVENGKSLLIDFGLAGYWGESIVGTPTYLAPEIYRGDKHSIQSDLYAVGVMLYNCLARIQPFSGKDINEIYDRHRTHTPLPLSQINPLVPKYMDEVAFSLLSKKPEERYSSASDVIAEISEFSGKKYAIETQETLLTSVPKTSEWVGRGNVIEACDGQLEIFRSENHPIVALFVHGEHGAGKTKLLSNIRTRLQLEKIIVEDVVLPLSENDRRIFDGAQAVLVEDVDQYFSRGTPEEITADLPRPIQEFISLIEQKILSPETKRFFIVLSATDKEAFSVFTSAVSEHTNFIETVEVPLFNEEETTHFLKNIIGQDEIQTTFVTEVFRNTFGNPFLCEQIIHHLIEQGLLFDESGRWNADLLLHLGETLRKMESPKSLDDRLWQEYERFPNDAEKEMMRWLAMAPHGLNRSMLEKLTGKNNLKKCLREMVAVKKLRMEENDYFLYRSALIPLLRKKFSELDQEHWHDQILNSNLGLAPSRIYYHQSLGSNLEKVCEGLKLLGDDLARRNRKEGALECFTKLLSRFPQAAPEDRVEWAVKGSEMLIWLDRFVEAENLLSEMENELNLADPSSVSQKAKLKLWEKKGLCLLHQRKVRDAESYFAEGLKEALLAKDCLVEEIRFHNDLAQIDVLMGRFDEAIRKFHESREKARVILPHQLNQITNNDLGHLYFMMKKYDEAINYLKEDIQIFENLPQKEPLARAMYSLAECYRSQKMFSEAVDEYEKCISICQADNVLSILLRSYNGIGNMYLIKDLGDQALQSYQRAIEISVHLKDSMTKSALLVNQGLIYYNQKNWPQASRRFQLARQILEGKPTRVAYENQLLAKCYDALATIAQSENDTMKALSLKLEQLQVMEKNPGPKSQAFTVQCELASLYLQNHLKDPLKHLLAGMEKTVESVEEKEKWDQFKKELTRLENFSEHDCTMKVSMV